METQLNPVQKMIAEGVSPIVAFLSQITCGEGCWKAREFVCKCSCGGKNHGCMKSEGGESPDRIAKIDGDRYKLIATGGRELYAEAKKLNEAGGYKYVDNRDPSHPYHYWWSETDPGAPARVKSASKVQLTKWPELKALSETPMWEPKYLLWQKIA